MGQREKGRGRNWKGRGAKYYLPSCHFGEQQERGELTELAFKGGLAHAQGDYTATSHMRIDYEVTVVVGPWVGQVSA